ncbi:MAG: hypothetical protein QOD59_1703 [Mycobacterium sp.]|nr:hypothetical protein [Mycobacterium sp.]
MVHSGRIARTTIGLLSAATLVFFAPVAAATPDADADAAISAAWDAGGGAAGPLGPKDGGVYPAGEGFGQNFAGGKIFFTPATGAHIMTGLILDKYQSLGGPADSDLGFPTIDEGAGRAPGSRNTTFSATDKPVIFWTPDTGAQVVRGPINAAWDKLGGSAGTLGVPTEDETYGGAVVSQKFTGGDVSYDRKAKTFTTVPPDLAGQLSDLEVPDDPASAINAARRAAGGALGPLGAAQGPPYPIGRDGLGQNFAGGKIFYSPETGANVVTGQVLAKYESVGGPQGDLGFPTSSEIDGGLATESRMSSFAAEDKPVIFWTPDYGAVIVRGAMDAAWQKLGGATGALGAPIADQTESGDVITQRFSGGVISWDRDKKSFSTEPGNLASQLSSLQVPGQEQPKAANNAEASNTNGNKWFQWTWWWLLAIVPVVVLAGLVAFASLRTRRRGADDGLEADDPEFAFSAPSGYGRAITEHEPTAEDSAEFFGDHYSREGLGSLPAASTAGDYQQEPMSPWGSPVHSDEADTSREPVAVQQDHLDEDEDTDRVDTTPTRMPTGIERDPLSDTGRHARIEIDEPAPNGTALHLPLDDPGQAPDGYPIKADTKSGLYWAPGSSVYEEASAEIWFASEEIARTNGFVRAN